VTAEKINSRTSGIADREERKQAEESKKEESSSEEEDDCPSNFNGGLPSPSNPQMYVVSNFEDTIRGRAPAFPYAYSYARVDWKGRRLVVFVHKSSEGRPAKEESLSFHLLQKRVTQAAYRVLHQLPLSTDEAIATSALARSVSKWTDQLETIKKRSRWKRIFIFLYKILTFTRESDFFRKRVEIALSTEENINIAKQRKEIMSHRATDRTDQHQSLPIYKVHESVSYAEFLLRQRPDSPKGLALKNAEGVPSVDRLSFYSQSFFASKEAIKGDPDLALYDTQVLAYSIYDKDRVNFVAHNDSSLPFMSHDSQEQWVNEIGRRADFWHTAQRLNQEINKEHQEIRKRRPPVQPSENPKSSTENPKSSKVLEDQVDRLAGKKEEVMPQEQGNQNNPLISLVDASPKDHQSEPFNAEHDIVREDDKILIPSDDNRDNTDIVDESDNGSIPLGDNTAPNSSQGIEV
jgi:hypothetical protein